jgi:hypothetical protein
LQQPVFECRKSTTYSRTPSSWWINWCLVCNQCSH